MLTFGQLMLAILTVVFGLVVLPLLVVAIAGTWMVDTYEHHSWRRRKRGRGPGTRLA